MVSMIKLISGTLILILPWIQAFAQEGDPAPEYQWPSYRGYLARGYLDNANLPDTWNVETGENILWKHRIPGLGLSSPVIWGDQLFLTTAVSAEDGEGITANGGVM